MNNLHKYAAIYDHLNNIPDIQEIISTPILKELDEQEDFALYHIRQRPWQNFAIYSLQSVFDNIGWDHTEYPGSLHAYIIHVAKP
jgi:hypothetical protein